MTAAEASAGYADAARLTEQLQALGYLRGAYREFALPDPGIREYVTKMLGFQATIMQFASADQAHEAITFQLGVARQQPDSNIDDATVEPIADESAALTGTSVYEGTDVKVVVLFVTGLPLHRHLGRL
jgi:hypothetical protein